MKVQELLVPSISKPSIPRLETSLHQELPYPSFTKFLKMQTLNFGEEMNLLNGPTEYRHV